MEDEELLVDTPWGKLVTSKGLKYLLKGFQNDLQTINSSLEEIETRLEELESNISIVNANSRVQALEGSLKSLEDEIQEFRIKQTKFANHMKKTLELFYTRLDEVTLDQKK